MKSNYSDSWRLIRQFCFIVITVILLFFLVRKLGWKMAGDGDRVTGEQFATFFIATPLSKITELRGWGTSSYTQTVPNGYLCIECDELPTLNNAEFYKKGGDILELTDKFLHQFSTKAWPLLQTSEVECQQMDEGPSGSKRFFLHNRKTKTYFFARI